MRNLAVTITFAMGIAYLIGFLVGYAAGLQAERRRKVVGVFKKNGLTEVDKKTALPDEDICS